VVPQINSTIVVYFSNWGIKAELTIFFAFMILVAAAHAQFSTRARDSIIKITAVDYQNMLQQLGIILPFRLSW
jgi:hypothetical protein